MKTIKIDENIHCEVENGIIKSYITKSTDCLPMQSLGFKREEDAELAVAIAKAMKARGKNAFDYDLCHLVKYTFRLLGLTDSGWTE